MEDEYVNVIAPDGDEVANDEGECVIDNPEYFYNFYVSNE